MFLETCQARLARAPGQRTPASGRACARTNDQTRIELMWLFAQASIGGRFPTNSQYIRGQHTHLQMYIDDAYQNYAFKFVTLPSTLRIFHQYLLHYSLRILFIGAQSGSVISVEFFFSGKSDDVTEKLLTLRLGATARLATFARAILFTYSHCNRPSTTEMTT